MQPQNITNGSILAYDIRFVPKLVSSLAPHLFQMSGKIVQIPVERQKMEEGRSLQLFFSILNKRFTIGIERENLTIRLLRDYDHLSNVQQIVDEIPLLA